MNDTELEQIAAKIFDKLAFEFPVTVGELDAYDKEAMKSAVLSALKQAEPSPNQVCPNCGWPGTKEPPEFVRHLISASPQNDAADGF